MDFPQPQVNIPTPTPIQAPTKPSLRRLFVIALITALTVSALIAVIVFATGSFGETELKLLATTASVAGFSLIGLCCSLIAERPRFQWFGTIGIFMAAASLILIQILTWGEVFSEGFTDLTLTVNILAIAMAHASLLLLAFGPRPLLDIVIVVTCVLIGILALMLLYLVLSKDFSDEGFFRILGSVAILDALGTVVTPLLKKIMKAA